jgi:hypothetical protein
MATADASAPQRGPPRRRRRGLDILPILFKIGSRCVVVGAQNKKVATWSSNPKLFHSFFGARRRFH